ARRPYARDFIERILDELLLASRAMGSDGETMRLVAQALDEKQGRVAWAEFERLAPLDEERLAARVAVRPLGDRCEGDPLHPQRGHHLARGLELPAPSVDDDEIRRVGKPARLRRLALANEPREAPSQHLAHHRIVVARSKIRALDVERAVLVLDEAFRPRHDHRT